ncbi:MAG: hypothetical protein NTW08_01830 [Gammaproteobacteria bacterium]|nr:hypothetical protein [Gammaproteobacteria bacterium]
MPSKTAGAWLFHLIEPGLMSCADGERIQVFGEMDTTTIKHQAK